MSNVDSPEGGCLCGTIRYRLNTKPENVIQCHCADCQKASGTGSSLNTLVPTEELEMLQGEPSEFTQAVDSGRVLTRFFCSDCGSPLFTRRENAPERTILKVGSLDDPSAVKIVMNVWTGSAQPWTIWDKDLPAFEQNRPV